MTGREKVPRKARATKRPKQAADLKREIASLKRKLAQALHRATETKRRQARQLELTHDTIVCSDAALLESERGFRLLVQGVSDYAIYGLDPAGRVVSWNPGAERIKGYRADEVVGRHFARFYTPEDVAAGLPERGLATAAREGRYESEGWRLRKDGSRFWAAVVIDAIRDDNGMLIGFAKTARDITQRKEAEEMLRRSQAAYFAEAQRLSQTGSFGWNVATGELSCSDETFRIFGYDPSLKPSVDLALQRVHPDDRPRVRRALEQVRSNRQEMDLETRLLMPDGTVKTVHVRARALTEHVAGTPAMPEFVGAVMDVTARTEAYTALQRTEQRYRYLFDHMPMALLQLRTRGRVRRGQIMREQRSAGVSDFATYLDQHPEFVRDALEGLTIEAVNERATRMFGARDASELIAMRHAAIWRERPDTFRRVLESRFQGKWAYHEETRVLAIDGRPIDVLFTIARPERVDSDTGFVLYGFIDVTETVRTREKLQNLQAEFAHAARLSVLGELMASIAHELNQPLAALAANGAAGVRFLDRPEPDLAETREALRAIVANADRAGEIIARIRAMALGQKPRHVALSLHDVIQESLLFLRPEVQGKQVAVSLKLAPAPPSVLGDRTQLQQVIVNLAVNAIHAMTQARAARPILAIETAASPDELTFALEDSGPGISPEHFAHLFDSFFTTKDSGMGMGLAICRSIIEGHGGELRAENGTAYGGARFSFTLPVARPAVG
jgi:PAS domain S-box-containing protein